MLELRLLGTADLRRPGGGSLQSVTVQPKRLALLAYLAVARPRGAHRRDVLLGVFWPELETDRARAALSKALHHLRTSLGPGAIANHGEEAVELDATKVTSDVVRFEDALDAGRHDVALGMYTGDLLHGFFLSDAPAFERWLDTERARLRARAAEAAACLAAWREAAGDAAGAVTAARRAAELSGAEPDVRRLMALLDAAGDRAGALTAYDAFATEMRRELDVAPAPETQALAAAIRQRASGPLTRTGPSAPPAPSAPAAPLSAGAAEAPPEPAATAGRRRTVVAAAAALLLLAATGVLAHRAAQRAEPPLEPRRVLVLPFDNRTLDTSLDPLGGMTADWILDGVSRMGGFEVVPATAVWATQGAMPAGTGRQEGGTIRRLARELGAGTVLSGSYYRDGARIVLQARAHDAGSGRMLRPIGAVSVSRDSMVHGIDVLRGRVLAALAPVGDTVYHLRVAAPPPTYEAYREYIAAMQAFVGGDPALALRHYQRAAAADSGWAMPRIAAAIMKMNLDDFAGADSLVAPLSGGRERLGPLERGTVDMVLGMLHGRPASVYDAVTVLAGIAPGTINEYMVGEMARKLNRPAEALTVLEGLGAERGELRGWRPFWREKALSHHMLGDHRAELSAARAARALYPHSPSVLALEVRALAALGRVAELRQRIDERVASATAGEPDAGELMSLSYRELRWHGHREAAAELADRAVAWHRSRAAADPSGRATRARLARALLDSGRLAEAAELLRALRREAPADPVTAATLALVLARQGDHAEAARLSAEAAAHRLPQGLTGPLNRRGGEPALLRAAAAAWAGDSVEAVRLLGEAEADGLWFGPDSLCRPDLEPLRGVAAFDAWSRPRTLPGRES